jgi:response regulator NasT
MNSTDDRIGCTATLRSVAGSRAVVALAGELDVTTEPRLGRELEAVLSEHGSVELDLTDLTFMDSCGVRLIGGLDAEARMRGGELVVKGATGQVARVMSLARLVAPVLRGGQLPQHRFTRDR